MLPVIVILAVIGCLANCKEFHSTKSSLDEDGNLTTEEYNECYNSSAVPKDHSEFVLHRVNFNRIIKDNKDRITKILRAYEPLHIGGYTYNMSMGQIILSNGTVDYLTEFDAGENSTLIYDGILVKLNLNVSWDVIQFRYNYLYKYGFYFGGEVFGVLKNLTIVMNADVFDENAVTLNNFYFNEGATLDLVVRGSIFDSLANYVLKIMSREKFIQGIESYVEGLFRGKLEDVNKFVNEKRSFRKFVNLVRR